MKFSNKLKALRKQYNLTQEQLAEKLFVTRNAISKWENDKGYPNIDSLRMISKVFSITIDDLINDDEIKRITLENSEKITKNNNLIISIIIFFIYAMIGTLVPAWLFYYDPTAGIGYFLILAPICYCIIGIVAGFISDNKSYILLASLIAIIPTYFYFDTYTNSSLWYWEFIYYILFALSYLLINHIRNKKLSLDKLQLLIKILRLLLIVTFLLYVIVTISNIVIDAINFGSSPWYTKVLAYTFIFAIPITIELSFLIYFKHEKRRYNYSN